MIGALIYSAAKEGKRLHMERSQTFETILEELILRLK